MGAIEDALKKLKINESINNVFKGVIDDADKFLKKVPKEITKEIDNLENEINNVSKKITRPVNEFMYNNVEKPILDLTKGIDEMIEDFVRIVCFINKSPVRFRNLGAAFENVFDGVISEFIALGYALELGFNSISELVYYASKYLESYLECVVKFLKNFIQCVPFYILDIVGQILYLPIRLLMWLFSTFLFIDLYAREKQVWNGLESLDHQLYPYIGFHIIYYPKHIRNNCYVCLRLKGDVVKRKNKEVHNTFNGEIRETLSQSRVEFIKAFKHFKEVFEYPHVREPRHVK